jgi:hypothetical protein
LQVPLPVAIDMEAMQKPVRLDRFRGKQPGPVHRVAEFLEGHSSPPPLIVKEARCRPFRRAHRIARHVAPDDTAKFKLGQDHRQDVVTLGPQVMNARRGFGDGMVSRQGEGRPLAEASAASAALRRIAR